MCRRQRGGPNAPFCHFPIVAILPTDRAPPPPAALCSEICGSQFQGDYREPAPAPSPRHPLVAQLQVTGCCYGRPKQAVAARSPIPSYSAQPASGAAASRRASNVNMPWVRALTSHEPPRIHSVGCLDSSHRQFTLLPTCR